jgi:hypothetical protein
MRPEAPLGLEAKGDLEVNQTMRPTAVQQIFIKKITAETGDSKFNR